MPTIPYAAFPGLAKQAWQALEGFHQRLKQYRENELQLNELVSRYETLITDGRERLERLAYLESNQTNSDVSHGIEQLLKDIDRYESEFVEVVRLLNQFQDKNMLLRFFRALCISKKVNASKDKRLHSDQLARAATSEVNIIEEITALHGDIDESQRRISHVLQNSDLHILEILHETSHVELKAKEELRSIQESLDEHESNDDASCSTAIVYGIFFWFGYVVFIQPFLPKHFMEQLNMTARFELVKMCFMESIAYIWIWFFICILMYAVPLSMYREYKRQKPGEWGGYFIVAKLGIPYVLCARFVAKQVLKRIVGHPDFVLLFLRRLTVESVVHFYIWFFLLSFIRGALEGFQEAYWEVESVDGPIIVVMALVGLFFACVFLFLRSQILGHFSGNPDFIMRFVKYTIPFLRRNVLDRATCSSELSMGLFESLVYFSTWFFICCIAAGMLTIFYDSCKEKFEGELDWCSLAFISLFSFLPLYLLAKQVLGRIAGKPDFVLLIISKVFSYINE